LDSRSDTRAEGVTRSSRDEDANLGEAGNLGRGKPIPVFFETLEHRV
jgi:hypothetical protein